MKLMNTFKKSSDFNSIYFFVNRLACCENINCVRNMVRDSEKVPFLSGSQYRSLFKTSECNGSPTNNIRDDPDGGRGRSICEELLVLFDWSTFLLILVFVLLGAAEMIGSPIWASSLVASRSDVSVKAFCFPIFASVIISAGALARWKIRRFGLSVISMFPFFYKQVIIYGVLVSVGMVLQAFCGLPTRTPAYLQAPTYIAAIIGAVGTAKILKRTSKFLNGMSSQSMSPHL